MKPACSGFSILNNELLLEAFFNLFNLKLKTFENSQLLFLWFLRILRKKKESLFLINIEGIFLVYFRFFSGSKPEARIQFFTAKSCDFNFSMFLNTIFFK